MKHLEQLELELWDVLHEAAIAPAEADLKQLLTVLEQSLATLDTIGQLQVAAEAIAQIVQVFQDRSVLAFEELEAKNSDEGPLMPSDAFDRYVRQTMEVDFDQFIEPIASLPRQSPERSPFLTAQGSVVGELDQVALLCALDDQLSQHPEWTEAEAFNEALNLAHDEDISTWAHTIAQWMVAQNISTIPLVQLQQSVEMPLVQLWLTLLLGGYTIEQRGEFYETEQIWVSVG